MIATLIVSLGPLATGLGKGYSSPAIASMRDNRTSFNESSFSVTQEEASWVASLSLLGAFFGGLPGAFVMRYGRQRAIFVVSLPFAIFWMLTVFANSVYMVYASSFLCGVCSAILSLVTPVYISEIAHPEIRGCLCSISKLGANIGMLLSFIVGAYVNWRQLAMFASMAPALLFVVVWAVPETPSFLLFQGDDLEAEKAYRWLNPGCDVTERLATMKDNIRDMQDEGIPSCYKKMHRDVVKPLLITCGMMIFQKFSGATAFNFYMVPILSEAFAGINPYNAAIVVALLQIVAGLVSSVLIDTVGRLPLLLISHFFMSVALAGFGTFLYSFQDGGYRYDWIPMTCAIVFQVAFAVGISPISWLYIGELFPLKHRGLGAIANSVSFGCSFVSVKTFVDIKMAIGLHGSFWMYSGFSIIGLIFTLACVPETKGETLDEMRSKYSPEQIHGTNYDPSVSNKLIT